MRSLTHDASSKAPLGLTNIRSPGPGESLRPGQSVDANGRVQFEHTVTMEKEDLANKSDSTMPLETDSCSDEEVAILLGHQDQRLLQRQRMKPNLDEISEQWGYDPKRLNRIRLRRERELEEFNFGINFTHLKTSKEQQKRLRKYLMQHQNELNHFVEAGSAPVFGYPPICYSPPNELKKNATGGRDYLTVLMRHVFQRPENVATIPEIINAKEDQDNVFNEL